MYNFKNDKLASIDNLNDVEYFLTTAGRYNAVEGKALLLQAMDLVWSIVEEAGEQFHLAYVAQDWDEVRAWNDDYTDRLDTYACLNQLYEEEFLDWKLYPTSGDGWRLISEGE